MNMPSCVELLSLAGAGYQGGRWLWSCEDEHRHRHPVVSGLQWWVVNKNWHLVGWVLCMDMHNIYIRIYIYTLIIYTFYKNYIFMYMIYSWWLYSDCTTALVFQDYTLAISFSSGTNCFSSRLGPPEKMASQKETHLPTNPSVSGAFQVLC